MTAAPVSPHDLDLRLVEVVFEHNVQDLQGLPPLGGP
jgi:hypothetical protein